MQEKEFIKRAPRLPLDVEVNSGGRAFAKSKNISETGIALITETPMTEGTFLQLKFFLPEIDAEVKAYGKVVRTLSVSANYYESGISFWEIDEEDKALLEEYFKAR